MVHSGLCVQVAWNYCVGLNGFLWCLLLVLREDFRRVGVDRTEATVVGKKSFVKLIVRRHVIRRGYIAVPNVDPFFNSCRTCHRI